MGKKMNERKWEDTSSPFFLFFSLLKSLSFLWAIKRERTSPKERIMKLFLIKEKKKKCCELKRKIMRTPIMCEDHPRERELRSSQHDGSHSTLSLVSSCGCPHIISFYITINLFSLWLFSH